VVERDEEFVQDLDAEKQNKLFVRYVFASNLKDLEEFAISYWIVVEGKVHEVLRYDCGKSEAVNAHYFFYKGPRKRYLDREKSFGTMLELAKDIEKNWRIYRLKFLEKKNKFI